MNEIVVNTAEGKSITFVGKLIYQVEGAVEYTDGFERKFLLKLHGTEKGGFVPVVEYLSSCDSELSGCVAEQVDLVDDIEKFYSVCEPNEFLPKNSRMTREESEHRRQLSSRLIATYDQLTMAMLDELERILGKDLNPEEDVNSLTKRPGGLWKSMRGES